MLLQVLLFAQASSATPAAPVAASTVAPPAAQKVLCHLEDTGQTRIAQRVCHTKAEWDQIERQSEDDFTSNMNKQNNPGNKPE